MNIAFVVLHYKVNLITETCIEYLLNQKYEDYEIIVIDNCSGNDSYEKLVKKYKNNKRIYFVSIEYNLGFAKANDLGYQIAKHKFEADCIAVINNDLFIKDINFCSRLSEFGEKKQFYLMGPDIINKTGDHQNPLKNCAIDKKTVQYIILLTKIKIILLPYFYELKRIFNQSNIKDKYNYEKTYIKEYMEDVPLHGSCLIFGKKFIDNFEYPFYPDTFLYGEEDILYFKLKSCGIKTIYNPDFRVYHVEDVSTESISKSSKNKRMFELKNSLKSLKILKRMMNEEV